MNANIAVGLLEIGSIATGVETSDVMCKMAQVDLLETSVIAKGKYTILIAGPVGEVESSMRAGVEHAGDCVIHRVLIRNVHEQVLAALKEKKRRAVGELDAYGLIETKDAIAAVHAADAAAKAAKVHLIDLRTAIGGGKGYVSMTGEVAAVRTAVGAGIGVVPDGMLVSHIVIAQPDTQLLKTVGA